MIMKWSYVLIESLLFKNKNWKDVLQPMNNMVYLAEKPQVNLFAHLLNWNNDSFVNHFGNLNLTVFHIVAKFWHTKYPVSFFKAWLTALSGFEQGMFPVQSEHAIELKLSPLLTDQFLAIAFIKRNKAYQLKWWKRFSVMEVAMYTDLVVGKKKRWCNNALRPFFLNICEYFSRMY